MVVLSAEQVRAWDRFTIEQEPIASIDLMERAAKACIGWMEFQRLITPNSFYIFCGKGNNGGDGLAIARLLSQFERPVEVFILEHGQPGSPDFQTNLHRLHDFPVPIHYIQDTTPLPVIPPDTILVDALLGTGLNRPPAGLVARLIAHLNNCDNPAISIDLPSGLFSDQPTPPDTALKASLTLSFQCYKTALLLAENAPYFGTPVLLDIGLHRDYLPTITPVYELPDRSLIQSILQPRPAHAHKGKFGHALLLAGSSGKMGAAILAAKACLRSGPGLLSTLVPEEEKSMLPISLPETMTIPYGRDQTPAQLIPDPEIYRTIGLGPGLGQSVHAKKWLSYLVSHFKSPMVLDADALNMLAADPSLLEHLPAFSILTPHPKEFERLVGPLSSDFDRLKKASELAIRQQVIVVLKGHHSFIAMPGGRCWFNPTGNASMAKGGSGDVLTGMLTGLLARGYAPEQATLLGVYLHGLCGEIASQRLGMESVLASDLIDSIGSAFISLQTKKT